MEVVRLSALGQARRCLHNVYTQIAHAPSSLTAIYADFKAIMVRKSLVDELILGITQEYQQILVPRRRAYRIVRDDHRAGSKLGKDDLQRREGERRPYWPQRQRRRPKRPLDSLSKSSISTVGRSTWSVSRRSPSLSSITLSTSSPASFQFCLAMFAFEGSFSVAMTRPVPPEAVLAETARAR